MIYAVCIGKARDRNNVIVQYKLRDFMGQESILNSDALKDYISKGRITVCNLTLTSDNKLMEKKVDSLMELNSSDKVQHINVGRNPSMTPNTPNVIPEQSQHHAPSNNNEINRSNAYKAGEMLYYVAYNGNLNIRHIPSGMEETLASKVGTACYIPRGHKLYIFYTIVNGEDLMYYYMILDISTNEVLRNGRKITSFTHSACIGKTLCPDNEYPYYHDKNFEFLFVPVRAKVNGEVCVIGILALDTKEGEHSSVFRKGMNAARCISRIMGVFKFTGNSVVSMVVIGSDDNSTDLRSGGILISLNKKLQIIESAQL